MRVTLKDIVDRFHLNGADVAEAASDLEDSTPWYVTGLAGFGTWVGAFLVGIALAMLDLFEEEGARIFGGAVLLMVAPVIARASHKAVATQAALIAVIAGEVLFFSGFDFSGAFSLTVVVVLTELYVIAAVNRPLTRAMATLAALWSLVFLCKEEAIPVDVVPLLAGTLGVVGLLFEQEQLKKPWSRLLRPVAMASLLGWLAFWSFEAATANLLHTHSPFTVAAPALHAAAAAAALVFIAWPAGNKTRAGVGVVALLAAGIALSLPGLLAALVVVAVGVRTRARLLTGVAVAFCLYFLWLTYWRLDITLLQKALWSTGLGLLLLVVRAAVADPAPALPTHGGRRAERARKDVALAIAAATVFVLVLGGLVIDKEATLSSGRRVLLPLVPRDPRSLMQGDYMALRTQLARDIEARGGGAADAVDFVFVSVDGEDVASFVQLADGAEHPELVKLRVRSDGRRVRVGAEEMFFQEGDAKRFEGAKFGEVRVDKDGEVVLVGLCGADKQRL